MSRAGCDYELNFIVVGDAKVGKTSLLDRYSNNSFNPYTTATLSIDFRHVYIDIDDRRVKIALWDTAGQERFRSIARSYYRNSIACFLVYDISCRDSFHSISKWLADVRSLAHPGCICTLVENKMDLESKREVEASEGEDFARDNNLRRFSTSALTNDNVADVFESTARLLLQKIDNGEVDAEKIGAIPPPSRRSSSANRANRHVNVTPLRRSDLGLKKACSGC